MDDWVKGLLGDSVAIPPVEGIISGAFEIPPLAVDLSGTVGDLLAMVPLANAGSEPGFGGGNRGSLLDSIPALGEMPAAAGSPPPIVAPSRAPVTPSVRSPAGGSTAWQPATRSRDSVGPGALAAPKPVERHAERTHAPKPVELHAEQTNTPRPVEQHAEQTRAPKPVARHAEQTHAPRPVEQHAEQTRAPKPVARHPAPVAAEPPPLAPEHHHRRPKAAPGRPARVDVLLISEGSHRDEVLAIVKRLLGCKTRRARKIVERAPVAFLKDVPYADGEQAVSLLRAAGGDAELNWQE